MTDPTHPYDDAVRRYWFLKAYADLGPGGLTPAETEEMAGVQGALEYQAECRN